MHSRPILIGSSRAFDYVSMAQVAGRRFSDLAALALELSKLTSLLRQGLVKQHSAVVSVASSVLPEDLQENVQIAEALAERRQQIARELFAPGSS